LTITKHLEVGNKKENTREIVFIAYLLLLNTNILIDTIVAFNIYFTYKLLLVLNLNYNLLGKR